MVTDLLRDELCLASIVLPGAKEELAQEWIQGFLLASQLVLPRRILLFQSGQEPLEDEQRPFGRIWLQGWGDKDGWVFCPVSAELDQGGGAENEGWCRQGREIAIERCD